MATELTDTILIVDDEEPVRKTFREWLAAEPGKGVIEVGMAFRTIAKLQ